MTAMLQIGAEVAQALSGRRPVVALESTVIAHGLPYPRNLETAKKLEAAVRAEGAVPATVGLLGGRLQVGLDASQLAHFAQGTDIAKVSRRDLGPVLAGGGDGATTVAATMVAARLAGIAVFATGGIGGVHRGGETSLDISADLIELGRTRVAVIASGAKSILDLPRTLEALETQGVPVIGYGCDTFPAFYTADSRLPLSHRVDQPEAAAAIITAQTRLGLESGLLFANPPPTDHALEAAELDCWTAIALSEADSAGIHGPAITPFLLRRLFELSDGRTLASNIALLEGNARLAARIAVALAALPEG